MHTLLSDTQTLKICVSLVAVIAYGVLRHVTARRNQAINIKLWCGLALLAILCGTWFAEIRSFLWSLTAVAAAAVIATKELISCATGSLLRRAGGAFCVGDRIEVEGVYGEVVSQSLFVTAVDELERSAAGPRRTGRRVAIPNSRLLSSDLRIDAPEGALTSLAFHMTFDATISTQQAVEVVEHHLRYSILAFEEILHSRQISRPVVTVETTDMGKIRLDVNCTVPAGDAIAFEREIKMAFLEWMWEQAQDRQAKEAKDRRRRPVNDGYERAA